MTGNCAASAMQLRLHCTATGCTLHYPTIHELGHPTMLWARTTPKGEVPLLSRCRPPLGVHQLAVRGVEPLRMLRLHILGVDPFHCCPNGRNTRRAGAYAHAWDVGDIDSLYNRNGPNSLRRQHCNPEMVNSVSTSMAPRAHVEYTTTKRYYQNRKMRRMKPTRYPEQSKHISSTSKITPTEPITCFSRI